MDDRRSDTTSTSPQRTAEPPPTVPDDLLDLLTTNRIGHVAANRADGSIAMYLMWVDWDGEHILTSSPVGSRKGGHWRRDPDVTLSVVDATDPWRYLIIRGHVTDIRPDEGLAFINRMSQRYTGGPYLRTSPREVFVITPDYIRASRGRSQLPPTRFP
jgi:PPOX class probable F420-dependent enzyme